jgi:hypothetical protein
VSRIRLLGRRPSCGSLARLRIILSERLETLESAPGLGADDPTPGWRQLLLPPSAELPSATIHLFGSEFFEITPAVFQVFREAILGMCLPK